MTAFWRKDASGFITLIPYGGVARRVRTIASAIDLFAEKTEKRVEILWFTTDDFSAPSERLFTLSPKYVPEHITIREATTADRITNDVPCRSNLFLSAPFVFVKYDLILPPSKVTGLVTEGKEYAAALREVCSKYGERVLMSTNETLTKRDSRIYRYLVPTVEVTGVRNSRMSGWHENVVGVHLSRSNDANSYAESPTELFIQRMQKMIERDPTTSFFLATTDSDEMERLQTIFRNRVFAIHSISEPGSPENAIESYGELLALSHTRMILTTPNSTFSEVASEMGRVPMEQLSIFNLSSKR